MKSILELERIAERITYFVNGKELKEAVDQLKRLVNYSLSDAFDEVEKRAEAKSKGNLVIDHPHYAAIKELRTELGIERKIGCPTCSPR